MVKKLTFLSLICGGLSACTSIQVNNTEGFQAKHLQKICIIHNPKVIIDGFETTMIQSFKRYNIQAQVYPESAKPVFCDVTMTYTALRTWDVVTYLSSAQFTLYKDNKQVSEAKFHLKGKGGFAFNKWRSTETKVNELVDELLK
ncbi:Sbal_3080 family lipoprotein [Acinetobacter portensis]|uniref:Sbal_3080 family lipoprotein n=1 Tax=Acinetobacter portensis TaxID=1839785 RepID=UPI00148F9C47|nr:Sbal_3080 family lipoprotein [Acinetobacter portensis]